LFQVLLGSLGYEEIYITFKSDDLIISKVNLLVDTETVVEQ
jgi:hypothetical protein